MKKVICIFTILLSVHVLSAQDAILGLWKTIDDETGKPRSVVEIFKKDKLYFGKIVKLFRGDEEDPDPVCTECKGEKNGERIIGMEIISDMKYSRGNDEYTKGEILDPESGNVYDCKLWIEEDKLKVRGYLLFFYRTQTWLPYDGS